MKVYKLTRPSDYKGLFKVSLVDDPAIQVNLMAFDAEKPEFIFSDEEKRIIYAPALIPNKLIFRKDINGAPAHVFFDAETIAELRMDYFRRVEKKTTNLNHEEKDIEGVFSFENWIVEDLENDRAIKMGFEVPLGTLMMGYKIDNEAVWQDIKAGNLKGLSIEAQLFPVEQLTNLKKENMNKKNIIDKIIALFADEKTEYATGFFGTSLEKGSVITDADGNVLADSAFEYEKNKYKTDAEGKISEIEEVKLEGDQAPKDGEALAEAQAKVLELETKVADLEAKLTEATATKMANEVADLKMKADLKLATDSVTKLTADIIALKKIKPITDTTPKKYEEMNGYERTLFNKENKK